MPPEGTLKLVRLAPYPCANLPSCMLEHAHAWSSMRTMLDDCTPRMRRCPSPSSAPPPRPADPSSTASAISQALANLQSQTSLFPQFANTLSNAVSQGGSSAAQAIAQAYAQVWAPAAQS